ncbi:MAG: Stp1/IreP family PP2C-type Ser/Thr phosphatase [Ignavibacterium sp.]
MILDYISVSNIGQKRKRNEDYVGIYSIGDRLLVILCDGIGGNNAGDVASRITVESISEYFNLIDLVNTSEKIKASILAANDILLKISDVNAQYKGMSTTLALALFQGNQMFWSNVGDSRIYFKINSELKQLTKDDSLVQKLLDNGFINEEQALNHPNKNVVIKSVGENKNLEFEVNSFYLNEKDKWKIFLCTDGVTNVLSDQEIDDILNNIDLQFIKQTLINRIEERGAPDNYSFIIIQNTAN